MTTRSKPVFNPTRPGKVAVLVAIMLPTVLIPVLAIGVDGGTLMEDRRRLQAAADAAALAAAAQLYRDNSTFISNNANTSQPPNTSGAEVAALDTLTQLGFEAEECEFRTVTMPASSSNPRIHNMPGTIEVKTTFLQPRSFSALWGTDKLKVAARAVARVKNFSQGNGIILLEESDYDALQNSGDGMLIVNRGGVVVNSTHNLAAETEGSSTVLAAKSFDVTGKTNGDRFFETPYPAAGSATPYTGSVPAPDPLRDLPDPSPSAFVNHPNPKRTGQPGEPIVLEPGRYSRRLSFEGGDTQVILNPGTYYLEDGIHLSGDAKLTGVGVTIINAGSGPNGGIDLSGQGEWSLSAPTSGTYQGVSLYQSRNTASESTTMKLSGNGGAGLIGTVYAPTTRVELTGNGTQVLGSQFIARTLDMSGGGHFIVDFAAPKAPQPPLLQLVE